MSLFKRGDVWWYKFRFCGQVVRESTKTPSKPLAREAERARRKQLEEGYNGITRIDRVIMFDNAADAWLDSRKPHVAPKTVELYKLALSHLKKAFSGVLLSNISAEDIGQYQARRTAQGAAGRTVNMEIGVLRAVLKKHRLWGLISDGVEFLRERRDVGRAISPEEEMRLLEAAADRRYSECFDGRRLTCSTAVLPLGNPRQRQAQGGSSRSIKQRWPFSITGAVGTRIPVLSTSFFRLVRITSSPPINQLRASERLGGMRHQRRE